MNRFKYRLSIIIGLSAICSWVNATTLITLNKQKSNKIITTEVIKSDPNEYMVKVMIHGISDDLVKNGNNEYHKLSIDGVSYTTKVGEPSLPLFVQSIAIPAGAKASASITDEHWTDIEIGKILPVQKPLLETERATSFNLDEKSYLNSYIPPLLSMGEEMLWRNIRNRDIAVCPFRYYPTENRLSVMYEFILKVNFAYDIEHADKSFIEQEDPLRLFDNLPYTDSKQAQPHTFPHTKVSKNDDNYYNYLIIVGKDIVTNINNNSKLNEFKRWKAFKGYKTRIVTTDTTGTSTYQIKNYITNEYGNGVRYVLLVGDNDKIPMYDLISPYNNQKWINSDYWYGCLFGNDAIAEIPIGRFATNSLAELENMVDKTIKYEKKYVASNKVLLVAHEQNENGYKDCCETIRQTNYTDNVTFIKAYGDTISPTSTNAYVVQIINEGAHIVNYRGHGKTGYWGGPDGYTNWNSAGESFTTEKITEMDDGTSAVFFSIACYNGNIAHPDTLSMLEVFTRSPKGAVAFLGASVPTYTDINHHFDRLLFKSLLKENVYHFGDINLRAHNKCIINIDSLGTNISMARDNAYCYICGGDPTLELWTATPQNINASISVNNGNVTVNTNLSGNYYISIVSETGERLDSISCSSSICTFPIPANKCWFVINKHNYFPKVIYYDSVSQNIVNMRYDYDAFYTATPIDIHIEATGNDEDEGTIVRSSNKLVIKNGSGGVTINEGFKCELGAEFVIE